MSYRATLRERKPMDIDIAKLRDKRNAVLREMQDLLDRAEKQHRALTQDEERRWNELDHEADRLALEIRKAGVTGNRCVPFERLGDPVGRKAATFLRSTDKLADLVPDRLPGGPASDELRFGRLVVGLATGNWEGREAERRALATTPGSAGGYLVPDTLAAEVLDLARAKTVCLQAGAVTVPMTSSTLRLATVTADPTPTWRAENTELTPATMTFGSIELQAKTLAIWLPVSIELMEDAPNAAEVIENAVAGAMAVAFDRAALVGSGTGSEPLGLMNASGLSLVVVGSGNGGVPTSYQPLVQGVQLIRMANQEPNAVIMSPRTAGTFDGLVDSTGQPLTPPPAVSALKRFETTSLPDNLTVGTSTDCSVAFVGDFSQLAIGLRTDLLIEVERPLGGVEGRSLQAVVRCYLRGDVAVLRPSAFAKVTGLRA